MTNLLKTAKDNFLNEIYTDREDSRFMWSVFLFVAGFMVGVFITANLF